MATDMFLFFEGSTIKGETADNAMKSKHAIDIQSFSWGLSNSGTAHVGGGAGAGKSNFQSVSVTKGLDKASAPLKTCLLTGEHIGRAQIVFRKAAGKAPLEYLVYKMEDVMVTSYSIGGGGDSPTESITLDFAKVAVEYKIQDEKGAGKAAGEFTWNIKENHK